MKGFNSSHPTISFGESFQGFSVTPPSLLTMGEGIKDALRSSVAGSRLPPILLTGPDSCV